MQSQLLRQYGSTQGPEQTYAGTDGGTEMTYVAWKGP